MSRLTVRLPDSLHRQLADQAEQEGVSLNHYIVYTLTRTVTATELDQQKRTFDQLRSRFPNDEAEAALLEVLAARSR